MNHHAKFHADWLTIAEISVTGHKDTNIIYYKHTTN